MSSRPMYLPRPHIFSLTLLPFRIQFQAPPRSVGGHIICGVLTLVCSGLLHSRLLRQYRRLHNNGPDPPSLLPPPLRPLGQLRS